VSGHDPAWRVLLVENDPEDESLSLAALRSAGLDAGLDVARDGEAALDYLSANRAHRPNDRDLPDLVILDLRLPGADGLDVLREIRACQRTRLLPVVVFTSSEDEDDLRKSYENGATSFVRKPAGFDAFQRTVAALGRYWLTLNQPPPRAWT
jgi:CheY-like chemotaxis protein